MAALSSVSVSDLEAGRRLDAEYYRPELKELARQLSYTAIPLRVIAKRITQGPNPHFTEAGVPCLNGRNVVGGRINLDNTNFVSRDEFEGLIRYKLRKGDILVTLKGLGSIGQVALVTHDMDAIFSRDLGLVRLHPSSGFLPEYVYACLASPTGRSLLDRGATGGTGQMTLTTAYLGSVPIQPAELSTQTAISELVRACESKYEDEREYYRSAERALLRAIAWKRIQLSQPKSWHRRLSCIKANRRCDAEHFQPKYEELLAYLDETKRAKPLADIITHIRRGLQPRYVDDGPILVINSRHVGKRHIKLEAIEHTDEDFWYEHPKARVVKYNVVMNSTGWGTIGRANCILHDQRSMVDNHVAIIGVREEECNPLYLATYLNSKPGAMQTAKWLSGSSGQVEIYPSDIARFAIFVPARHVQEGIAGLILRSYQSNQEARSLMEQAKAAAERVIHEGTAKGANPTDSREREERETWASLKRAIDLNRAGSRQIFK